jgi:hypothetical protein
VWPNAQEVLALAGDGIGKELQPTIESWGAGFSQEPPQSHEKPWQICRSQGKINLSNASVLGPYPVSHLEVP